MYWLIFIWLVWYVQGGNQMLRNFEFQDLLGFNVLYFRLQYRQVFGMFNLKSVIQDYLQKFVYVYQFFNSFIFYQNEEISCRECQRRLFICGFLDISFYYKELCLKFGERGQYMLEVVQIEFGEREVVLIRLVRFILSLVVSAFFQ